VFGVSDRLALSNGIRLPAIALRTSQPDHAYGTSWDPLRSQTQETCLISVRDSEVATVACLLSSLAFCLIPEFPKISFALTSRG
jgi:hypothetical protein